MPVPSQTTIHMRLTPVVLRDLQRRGNKIRTKAQNNLRGGGGAPRRVASGELLRTIWVRVNRGVFRAVDHSVQVGSSKHYAGYVIRGTGIYGPHKQRIRPVRAKALHFYWDKTGRMMTLRSVAGMPRNNFLVDAMSAAKD